MGGKIKWLHKQILPWNPSGKKCVKKIFDKAGLSFFKENTTLSSTSSKLAITLATLNPISIHSLNMLRWSIKN
jgi:hypothetical protein